MSHCATVCKGYRGRLKQEAEETGHFAVGDRRFYNLMFERGAAGDLTNREGCKHGTLQQRHRMIEGCAAEMKDGQVVSGKMMNQFPFPVSAMPGDNILFSCVDGDATGFTSTLTCDYDEFASDHVPVKATITSSKGLQFLSFSQDNGFYS